MRLRLLVVALAAILASRDARAQLLYGDFETLQILGSPDYLGNTSGYPAAPWQMITNDAFVPAGLYTNFGPDEGAPFCCDQLGSVPPVDGKHYLLLTPRTLSSIPSIEAWLEMGGTYAEANLRGGGEYGESWHKAGTLANKQHVFDDFIAAAEFLVAENYTRRARLGIYGRSNGGLLIGAVLTQRPDLFGAALPAVGVLDMLRYQTASANARQWSSDYGLSEDPEQFRALYAYSPVQNVKRGVCYPPTLITTADHDDRVVPWHSYKFGAALQAAQLCPNPILIRIETRAGHGAGKPTWMQIQDFADQWAFLAKWLQMAPPPAVVQ